MNLVRLCIKKVCRTLSIQASDFICSLLWLRNLSTPALYVHLINRLHFVNATEPNSSGRVLHPEPRLLLLEPVGEFCTRKATRSVSAECQMMLYTSQGSPRNTPAHTNEQPVWNYHFLQLCIKSICKV